MITRFTGGACLFALVFLSVGQPAVQSASSVPANSAAVMKRSARGAMPESAHPDQSSVAAKVALKTVRSGSPQVITALKAKDLAKALGLVGKPAALQGTVTKVYSPGDHDVVILDFDPDYHNTITAIARPESYKKLPDLKGLTGKHILVIGTVTEYRGKAEFEIKSASQLSIIK